MRNAWTNVEIDDNTEGMYALHADGTITRDVDFFLTEKQYDEMKQGYRCCRCLGLTGTAFPETCGLPGCDGYPKGFPMRERQRQVMESEMQDEVRKAPAPKTNIWIPGRN